MKNPKIDNHSEILTKLQQAKWIAKIADVDSGKNIYWMTLKGQENYAVICNLLQRHQMYSGPTLSKFFLLVKNGKKIKSYESFTSSNLGLSMITKIDTDKGKDVYALTPKGAEYMYMMTESHAREEFWFGKPKAKGKKGDKTLEQKIGEISIKVIKGVNKVGKMSGDLSDAMSKMGTTMGGDTTKKRKGKTKKIKMKKNQKDEYSKLGDDMMKGGFKF